MINTSALHHFLLDSNQAGYAGGEEKKWLKEPDGSTTIPYEKGEWRSQDNFFGGEPYGGRIVVFHRNKPVWIMVYYGQVAAGIKSDPVYAVLREALKAMPTEAPFRGPTQYTHQDLTYLNTWQGDIPRYSGEEKIIDNRGNIIYQANYQGGLVDQQVGI